MKKKVFFIFLTVFLLFTLLACQNKTLVGYDTYFNNFTSTSAYTKATPTLRLASYKDFAERGVFVSSYEESADIYIITENITLAGKDYTLNGFCSAYEVLIEPRYTSILAISGDYAIVTRTVAEGSQVSLRVGLVKIRGENKGKEFGFSYNYALGITQYSFLDGKYLSVLGDKNFKNSASGNNTFTYATIYDYVSGSGKDILEVGRLKNVVNTSTFQLYDNNLISITNNAIRFHFFDDIGSDGYYNVRDTYIPYLPADGYLSENVTSSAYYIGNNWFVLSSIYSTSSPHQGYEMEKKGEKDATTYVTIRSVRYTTLQNKSYDTDRVVMVANKHTENLVRLLTSAVNFQEEYYTDSTGTKGVYFQPVVPTSSAVSEGYSIVYYTYFYYIDGAKHWADSFSIYDENANVINLDIIMPLVFVDGIGLQNADPNFNLLIRDAEYYLPNKQVKKLSKIGEKVAYDPAVVHSGMILTYDFNLNTLTSMLGAYDATSGNLAVPFRYYELTLFFDEYATGSMVEGEGEDSVRKFYRINRNGRGEEISNVYALKNGVYITKQDKQFGLYANDGTLLIKEECDNISVIDTYLKEGKYITSTVVTIEDGCGVIYRLD